MYVVIAIIIGSLVGGNTIGSLILKHSLYFLKIKHTRKYNEGSRALHAIIIFVFNGARWQFWNRRCHAATARYHTASHPNSARESEKTCHFNSPINESGCTPRAKAAGNLRCRLKSTKRNYNWWIMGAGAEGTNAAAGACLYVRSRTADFRFGWLLFWWRREIYICTCIFCHLVSMLKLEFEKLIYHFWKPNRSTSKSLAIWKIWQAE